MLNNVNIAGRITKELELKSSESGREFLNFSVAVDRDFKNKETGERECDFINCSAFGNTAKFISQWFGKGRMILIQGRLQVRKWVDKEGNNRYSTDVVVNNAYFCDSKKDNNSTSEAVTGTVEPTDNFAVLDDDNMDQLPF